MENKKDNVRYINLLLERIASGDKDAFATLYEMYFPRLSKLAFCFLKEESLCYDVVADIFTSLWFQRKTMVKINSIESYLYTSVKNQALKRLKQKKDHDFQPLQLTWVDEEKNPEEQIISEEQKQALDQAINSLPERCKMVFLMVKEEGLSYKETAKLLSVKEGTVHAQLSIAIKKIGNLLKGYFGNNPILILPFMKILQAIL